MYESSNVTNCFERIENIFLRVKLRDNSKLKKLKKEFTLERFSNLTMIKIGQRKKERDLLGSRKKTVATVQSEKLSSGFGQEIAIS